MTTRDGRIFELDLYGGVTLVEDLNGNQLSITPAGIMHSSGKGIAFERDAEGRIERITDPMNRVNGYAYDEAGDLVSFTDRAGAVTRFGYDHHRLMDIEDPRGVKPIRNEYDAEGRLVRHIDAFGKVIELGHDRDNRREVVTNRLGASRVLEYDARGNVVRETDELGKVTIRAFNNRDNLLTETDPLGRTTTYTYMASDDLASRRDPLGNTTSYTYESHGQLLALTDPRGGVTANAYDSRGNLTRTTDALGKITTFTYDTGGNLLTTTDALGHVSSFEYDSFGNQTKEVDVLGNETTSTYDGAGNRLTETRTRILPDGSTEDLTTTFAYDELDRLTTTITADGSSTSIAYDLLGNVTQRTDELGRRTTMSYDAWGRLIRTDHPDGSNESRSYDAEGRRLSRVDRAGIAYPNGVTTSYARDARRRLTSLTTSTGAGEVLQSYVYSLTPAGRRTRVDEYDGTSRHYVYDSLARLTRDQVTDADGNSVYLTDFSYDAAGNRTEQSTQSGGGTTLVAATYDLNDRLLTRGSTSYDWDANGNLLSSTTGGSNTYRWDFDNRLAVATAADGTEVRTTYDFDGNRVRTETTPPGGPTTAIDYVVDTRGALSQVVAEVVDGQVATVYTRVSDQLLGLNRGLPAERRFFHRDGSGSIRVLSDADGLVTDRYAYAAFGLLLEHSGNDPNPYQFAGEPVDSTVGLHFNRARWLDVESGRFVSMDPLEGYPERPLSLNRYLYAEADPANKHDPRGLYASATEASYAGAVRAEVSSRHSLGLSLFVLLKVCEIPGSVCGPEEAPRLVYRRTDISEENNIFDETGFILSSFARIVYLETRSIGQAFAEGTRAHHDWILEFNGNEFEYALWHQEFGVELEREFHRKRTFVSVSKSRTATRKFGGPGARIYAAEIPLWELIPTAPGPEGEFVFRIGRLGFSRVE